MVGILSLSPSLSVQTPGVSRIVTLQRPGPTLNIAVFSSNSSMNKDLKVVCGCPCEAIYNTGAIVNGIIV